MNLNVLWGRDLELSMKAYDAQIKKDLRVKQRCEEETKCAVGNEPPIGHPAELPQRDDGADLPQWDVGTYPLSSRSLEEGVARQHND